jgi:tetratricopeptide (TPR) repeat protein
MYFLSSSVVDEMSLDEATSVLLWDPTALLDAGVEDLPTTNRLRGMEDLYLLMLVCRSCMTSEVDYVNSAQDLFAFCRILDILRMSVGTNIGSIQIKTPRDGENIGTFMAHLKQIWTETESNYALRMLQRVSMTWAAALYERGAYKESLRTWDEAKKYYSGQVVPGIEIPRYDHQLNLMYRILCKIQLKDYANGLELSRVLEKEELSSAMRYQLNQTIILCYLKLDEPVPAKYRQTITNEHPYAVYISGLHAEYLQRAEGCIQREDYEFSSKLLERCLVTEPEIWWIWERLGDVRGFMGEREKSVEMYQKAMDLYTSTNKNRGTGMANKNVENDLANDVTVNRLLQKMTVL